MTTEVLDEDVPEIESRPLLSSFSVRELFGRYDYDVEVPSTEDGTPGRLLLLYGDNGSGKTTLLNLLWNILSPARNRGHRTAVAKVPFRSFSVAFSDGSELVVEKTEALIGSYAIRVRQPSQAEIVAIFEADDTGRIAPRNTDFAATANAVSERLLRTAEMKNYRQMLNAKAEQQKAEEAYYTFLQTSRVNPLFLADDRSLYTDDEEVARARERFSPSQQAVGRQDRESPSQVVDRELRVTIWRVNELLRTLALRGQNQGSMGANTIYSDVLKQLSIAPHTEGPDPVPDEGQLDQAAQMLDDIAANSPRFEEFELVPHFPAVEFEALLKGVPPGRRALARQIVGPYLTSLRTRMDALEDAESLLRTLLTLLNGFFVDKQFVFSTRNGLRIVTHDGNLLRPSALSSGERQLTMLLCTTILARRDSRIFIVDEPELSLGVRWQRSIVDSLLELTEGTGLQFIVATHSVEIITGQQPNLVRLQRSADGSE